MNIQRYRIEAGQPVQCRADVAVSNGVIIAAPPRYKGWQGRELYRLEWWLTSKYHSMRRYRLPDLDNPDAERAFWVQSLSEIILPTRCSCGQMLERTEDLETHMERGCWRAA